MLSLYVKGKTRILGSNKLTNPAHISHSRYPLIHGRHAELHVWVQAEKFGINLKGGTLYVTGTTAKEHKNRMQTTKPCKHCSFVLRENTNISSLVYLQHGDLVKESL